EKQKAELEQIQDPALQNALNKAIVADTDRALATKLKFDPTVFIQTINDFNALAKLGKDYTFGRKKTTMRPLTDGKLYAIKLQPAALNTQGGPRRNEKAEIIRPNNTAIRGLYGAGEAGSITTNQYQAGQDVAELLIFGKIAGENVANEQDDLTDKLVLLPPEFLVSDEQITNYQLASNQYLGKSNQGMGNELVLKVTVNQDTKKITQIDVVKQSETKEIGQKVIKPLLAKIIQTGSTKVDAIAGASLTSKAVKSAVDDALKKVH
ncbi:MAG: FMN-binding protein, partial [Bombilactobacillus sp.]|nr:FMN-binding protein [Bombilactobacillus sp.]